MPCLLLQGIEAADVWRRILKLNPNLERARGIESVVSIHQDCLALWTSDPAERQARLDRQQTAYKTVGEIVNQLQ